MLPIKRKKTTTGGLLFPTDQCLDDDHCCFSVSLSFPLSVCLWFLVFACELCRSGIIYRVVLCLHITWQMGFLSMTWTPKSHSNAKKEG